ncbi:hypothetical protein FACS189445_2290 [Spirochaetia bacterium]|nr:hypothetical protein FACS189445_2290 [Spirochaetia bacterium]
MFNYTHFKQSSICKGRDGKPKRIYPSSNAAWDSAYHRISECGEDLYPYHCEHCGGYHLTKKVHELVTSGSNWSLE